MKRAVYYSSGTGNTLCLARNVAEGLGAQLRPIGAFHDCETVETDAQLIGVVFPVYYSDAPVIVKEFIGKLENLKDKTVFAVCTHGGAAGDALRTVKSLLEARGGALSLAFGVPMPQNSFHKWYESARRRQNMLQKRCRRIVKKVERGAAGIRYHNFLLEWLMIPATKLIIKPACRLYFSKQSGMDQNAPIAEMIRNMDRGFYTLDTCNGCGACAKLCPVENIVMKDGRPEWRHHCENCLACYNFCPQKAVAGGIAQKGYFYRHPAVKVTDLMRKYRRGQERTWIRTPQTEWYRAGERA
jgi:ferredoxin/flavodoxin